MQDVNFPEAFHNVSCYQFLRARSGNMVEMRRAPAILLVFLFSFSLIGPALFVDAESDLPACCRRDGKHHCGMAGDMAAAMADAPLSGPAADALRLKCPFYPIGATLPEIGPALVVASPGYGRSFGCPSDPGCGSSERRISAFRTSILTGNDGPPAPYFPSIAFHYTESEVTLGEREVSCVKTIVLSFLMVVGVFAICHAAQRATIFGRIRGIVHDPQHRPLAGASVRLQAVTSDWSQTAQSDDNGEFVFTTVPVGDYKISVSEPKFENVGTNRYGSFSFVAGSSFSANDSGLESNRDKSPSAPSP